MSDKITIHKNKDEIFKCQINIEGAEDATVRLCLEFADNKNMFFYGELKNNECIVTIPKLKEVNNKSGKLFLEAIADSTYFKLYEANIELKNSVEIKVENAQVVKTGEEPKISETNVKVNNIQIEIVEPKVNPYLPKKNEEVKEEPKKSGSLTSWKDWKAALKEAN